MKKVYALIVGSMLFACPVFAQTFYWIGGNNGNWNDGNNWSLSSGGIAAADYPNDVADNAIFNANATLFLNTSIDINSLSVTGSSSYVKITGNGATDRIITVHSTNVAVPALNIAAGCVLEHSAATNSWFRFVFGDNTIGQVSGDWFFTGDIDDNAIASFYLGASGFSTRLNINSGGSITIGEKGFIEPNDEAGDDYLVFKGGSKLKLLGNGPIVPEADYAITSIIEITGVTDASVIFEEAGSVGTINYNCPSQNNNPNHLYLSLLTFVVNGDLNIYNTNNNELSLISFNSTSGMPTREATIKGNLNIQGNSVVTVAHNDGLEFVNKLYVEGDFIMNGTSLDLHSGNYISTKATTLYVKGDIQHNAGTISTGSPVVNQQANLYVIEMNGNSSQTISSHNGVFDNASHQLTLRMNNASGVSLLSDLAVGRLSFNSANKGVLSTNSHVLTVNNITAPSVSSLPLEMSSTPGAGYVNGTLRRKTATTEPVLFPVGDGNNYRNVVLLPAENTSTTFETRYVNTNHGGTLLAPVRGVANYYWEISRIGAGADAAVQLQIPGALPGALTGYDIAVTRYDGTNWISTKGTTGTVVSPGTATSGTIRSETQTSFGSFTISLESEAALPTYLVSFEARSIEKESAQLDWTVTDNSTPEHFEILRSSDGLQFKQIGKVESIQDQRTFRFTDPSLLPGNNYYKLAMIDKDGSKTYSVIRMVIRNTSGLSLHSLSPTLVYDRTKAKISSSANTSMQLIITDMSGRVVQKQQVNVQAGSQDVWINVSKLGKGAYQLTGYNGVEKPVTLRFIKL